MSYQIICQTPGMARLMATSRIASARQQEQNIRRAVKEQGNVRYVVIDAQFPRVLYLIWDRLAQDNVRGGVLGRFPWSASKAKMLRIAARMNRNG